MGEHWEPWYQQMAHENDTQKRQDILMGTFAPARPGAGEVASLAAGAVAGYGVGRAVKGFIKGLLNR